MTPLETKYLIFVRDGSAEEGRKTQVWLVYSRARFQLGTVKWYASWRQYCYFPEGNTVLANSCISDIHEFIAGLMEERKKSAGEEEAKTLRPERTNHSELSEREDDGTVSRLPSVPGAGHVPE